MFGYFFKKACRLTYIQREELFVKTKSNTSYSRCDCDPGFHASGDAAAVRCVDVDECEDGNNGGCQHFCKNTQGAHR